MVVRCKCGAKYEIGLNSIRTEDDLHSLECDYCGNVLKSWKDNETGYYIKKELKGPDWNIMRH